LSLSRCCSISSLQQIRRLKAGNTTTPEILRLCAEVMNRLFAGPQLAKVDTRQTVA